MAGREARKKEAKKTITKVVKKGAVGNVKKLSFSTLQTIANQSPSTAARRQAKLEMERRTAQGTTKPLARKAKPKKKRMA